MFFFGFVHAPNKGVIDKIIEKLRDGSNRPRVRCPACAWEPAAHDTWCCSPGCGHVWNTFTTYGCCPGCTKQWTHTACLRCSAWSPHDEWYETDDGDGKW